MQNQSYEHLIGKEVRVTYKGHDLLYTVGAIDPDIGITLNPNDSGYAKICMIDVDIHSKRHKIEYNAEKHAARKRVFQASFPHWIAGIESGELSDTWLREDMEITEKSGLTPRYTNGGADMCPFT